MRFCCLVIVAFFACTPHNAYPPPRLADAKRFIDFDLHAKRTVLPNGLIVVLLPDSSTELVNVDLRYLIGANGDPVGKAGLAHLVEHAMFELRPDPKGPSIAEAFGAGSYNAFTNWSVTHFTTTTTADGLARALELEALRMHPNCSWLTDDVVAREREVVLNELRMRQGVESMPLGVLLKEVFLEDPHYGRFVGGNLEEVQKLTRADICAFMLRQYSPRRAVLFVSGAVNVQSAQPLIAKLFSAPGQAVSDLAAVPAPRLDGHASRYALPVLDAGVEVAFAAPEFGSVDRPAADVLEYALQWVCSRLDEKDFVSAATVFRLPQQSLWVFSIWVSDQKRQEDAVQALFEEITKLEGDLRGLSPYGVYYNRDMLVSRVIRGQALGRALRAMESPTTRGLAISEYATARTPGLLPRELRAIATMEGEPVAALAERELVRDKSRIIFIEPVPKAPNAMRRAEAVYVPDEHDIPEWNRPVVPGDEKKPESYARAAKNSLNEAYLDNGLRVLVAPSFGFPTVTARLLFPSGSGDSPADSPCLAWLTAYSLNGTLGHDWRDEARVVFNMAGQQSLNLDAHTTTFDIQGPAPNQDGLLWQLGWKVVGGRTASRAFSSEPKRLEIFRREQRLGKTLQETFGGGSVCGDVQQADREIGSAPRETFRLTHFQPKGATLLLTGAWDSRVDDWLRYDFGTWSSGAVSPQPTAPAHPVAGSRRIVINDFLSQAKVFVGFELSDDPKEQAARVVLTELVRQRMQRLRSQLASTYTTHVELSRAFGPRLLLIGGDFNPARAAEMFKGIVAEISHIVSGDDFEADFVRARRAALHQALATAGDATRLNHALTTLASEGLPLSALDDAAEQIANQSFDALRAVVLRDLKLDRAAVVVEAPKSLDTETLKVLGGSAPTIVN